MPSTFASPSLSQLLRSTTDPVLLPVFAEAWGYTIESSDSKEVRKALAKVMTDPLRAEAVWDSLDDYARGAMQMLIGGGGRIPENKFERMFGEIHEMGSDAIAREKPLQRPKSTADALFYRGLIHRIIEHSDIGQRQIIFVPGDLRGALPLHKTSYDNIAGMGDDEPTLGVEDGDPAIEPLAQVQVQRLADTSLVDDVTTLLAHIRIRGPMLEGGFLSIEDSAAVLSGFIVQDERRLFFLTALAISAGLIEVHGGRAFPGKAEAQRWLSASRSEQVRKLADAWRSSKLIVDLAFVPGLHPELDAGDMPQYDPSAARALILEMMLDLLPAEGWWSRGEFIQSVFEDNYDFQRPNGSFEGWYIRNDSGEYLSGEVHWVDIEGAMLEYIICGPLHWLGLADLAEGAARLNAYGRGFLQLSKWPAPQDSPEKITIAPDGTIHVSRKVSRLEHYTVARFATPVSAAVGSEIPFVYRIDAQAVQQAAAQGIAVGQITASLQNMLGGGALPSAVARLLDRWKQGATANVTFERLIVLRTTSPEVLNAIYDAPATRRFFSARLGDMAAVVRADQWEALREVLGESGIQVELIGI
ncbi:MAG: hypothetical protein IAE89_09045 [Anaerolineae bacterium]|nr:hypothetical protein [Anaerolineae bacterium]